MAPLVFSMHAIFRYVCSCAVIMVRMVQRSLWETYTGSRLLRSEYNHTTRVYIHAHMVEVHYWLGPPLA
jgi:hypothetical protein